MRFTFKQLKNKALSHQERREIRERLQTFMAENPIPERNSLKERQLIYHNAYLISLTNKLMPVIIIIALIITLGGGTALAAETALPGDLLYPIKININEEVVSALTIGTENQAEWDAERAERRLEEAEQLAAEGNLDEETNNELMELLNEHLQDVTDAVAKLQAGDDSQSAADVISLLEASLEAHEALLAQLTDNDEDIDDDDADELDRLEEAVEELSNNTSEEREEIEKEITTNPATDSQGAAEGKMTAAQNKINEATKRIERLSEKMNGELAEAKALLADAQTMLAEGQAQLEAGEFNSAFLTFHESSRLAQSAKSLAQAEEKVDKVKKREQKKADKGKKDKDDDDSDDHEDEDKDDDHEDEDKDDDHDDDDKDDDHDDDDKDDDHEDEDKDDDHDDDDDEEDHS